jgi:hypothetical protein
MDPLADFEHECFFIAPIGQEGTAVRTRSDLVLQFIVRPAAEELGLSALRPDELAAPGQITHRVIEHILHARAAVADLTGRNANVYYELAVRHMARLPVALIVAVDDDPLPFDVQQMSVIRFDHTDLRSADQCRRSIVGHLSAALRGAVDSPIASARDVAQMGMENGEITLAELMSKVRETFSNHVTSEPIIAGVLRDVHLPRSERAQHRVGVALEAAVNKAADRTRSALFIEVDPGPLFGVPAQPWLLRYDGSQFVSTFVNNIWFKLSKEIALPPHSYGVAWLLRESRSEQEFFLNGSGGRLGARQKNQGSIAEAGVRSGMRLEAVRPQNPERR